MILKDIILIVGVVSGCFALFAFLFGKYIPGANMEFWASCVLCGVFISVLSGVVGLKIKEG